MAPTYYAKLMAEALREMPAGEGETHPATDSLVTKAAVMAERDAAAARERNASLRQALATLEQRIAQARLQLALASKVNVEIRVDQYRRASANRMPVSLLEQMHSMLPEVA